MNLAVQMGRLTADPTIRQGNTTVANFTIAVDRRFKRDGQPTADYHRCVCFGKTGEFVEKYLRKGTKIVVSGEIQNDNYEKDGITHYGYQIIANNVEFAESKKTAESNQGAAPANDDFMDVDGSDTGIPFN